MSIVYRFILLQNYYSNNNPCMINRSFFFFFFFFLSLPSTLEEFLPTGMGENCVAVVERIPRLDLLCWEVALNAQRED